MLGMEKMLAAFIGVEPDEMAAKVKEVETVFTTIAESMVALTEKQTTIIDNQVTIMATLERLENGTKKRIAKSTDNIG